jgi:hypothetical protein
MPTRIILEKDVEVPVVNHARRHGILVVKQTHAGARSHPDRAFYFPHGRLVQIEFKAPGKLPTPQQRDTIMKLLNYGYCVYVIDDKELGLRAIEFHVGLGDTPQYYAEAWLATRKILERCAR